MGKLEVDILTLFPRACAGYLGESILGKAQEGGLLSARVTDIRVHATGRHRVCDDAPYGGGAESFADSFRSAAMRGRRWPT